MLMSLVEETQSVLSYPELAGKRVLITGLTSSCGVDIVRAFAEHRARLVLQFDETSESTDAIAEIAAPHALDIKAFGPVGAEAEGVAQFARAAMQAFGGQLSDTDIATVVTYERNAWGNKTGDVIQPADIKAAR